MTNPTLPDRIADDYRNRLTSHPQPVDPSLEKISRWLPASQWSAPPASDYRALSSDLRKRIGGSR